MEKVSPLLGTVGSVRQVLDVIDNQIRNMIQEVKNGEAELGMWDVFGERRIVTPEGRNYIAERSHDLKITLNRTRTRLKHIQELRDSLPICSYCDGKGRTWQTIAEDPGQKRSIACPHCQETGERQA